MRKTGKMFVCACMAIACTIPLTAHAATVSPSDSRAFREYVPAQGYESLFNNMGIQEDEKLQSDIAYARNERNTGETGTWLENSRDRINELYAIAGNAVREHPSYGPASIKAETMREISASADSLVSTYTSLVELEEKTRPPLDKYFPHKDRDLLFAGELKSLQAQMQVLLDRAENTDFSVDYFNGFYDLEENRKQAVETALSLEGKISYEWGVKPVKAGWNDRWDKKGTGMDCSGFVQWVFWTVYGMPDEGLSSTLCISETQEKINRNELKPGDLGMIMDDGSYYTDYAGKKYYKYENAVDSNIKAGYTEEEVKSHVNHAGIYVGKDENGRDIWCHCQGGYVGTVTVGEYEKFVHFYRMPENLDKNGE